MQTTGIIRKIDELGRIVLPKELRKYLNINTGDDFQIILDNDKIILEKYSRMTNYEDEIINIINSFKDVTKYDIYISIKDKIINTNQILSEQIYNILKERKIYTNDQISKIILSKDINIEGRIVIHPLVIESDLLGGVIIISNDKTSTMLNNSKIIYNLIKDKITQK